MNELQTFSFEQKFPVRITDRDGSPWFVAKDVCSALELRNVTEAVRALDNDERGSEFLNTFGGRQKAIIISESGLYALILRSSKPKAKEFRRWVTGEVLPSIRRTGEYVAETLPALSKHDEIELRHFNATASGFSKLKIRGVVPVIPEGELMKRLKLSPSALTAALEFAALTEDLDYFVIENPERFRNNFAECGFRRLRLPGCGMYRLYALSGLNKIAAVLESGDVPLLETETIRTALAPLAKQLKDAGRRGEMKVSISLDE